MTSCEKVGIDLEVGVPGVILSGFGNFSSAMQHPEFSSPPLIFFRPAASFGPQTVRRRRDYCVGKQPVGLPQIKTILTKRLFQNLLRDPLVFGLKSRFCQPRP
jgi:hypothetical protein